MPSSISSFEIPAPERIIPARSWPRAALLALLLTLAGLVLWEWNARRLGYTGDDPVAALRADHARHRDAIRDVYDRLFAAPGP